MGALWWSRWRTGKGGGHRGSLRRLVHGAWRLGHCGGRLVRGVRNLAGPDISIAPDEFGSPSVKVRMVHLAIHSQHACCVASSLKLVNLARGERDLRAIDDIKKATICPFTIEAVLLTQSSGPHITIAPEKSAPMTRI